MATAQDEITAGLSRITALVLKSTVASGELAEGGKLNPKQGLGESGINPAEKCGCSKAADGEACKCAEMDTDKSITFDIIQKSKDDKQLVTGLVLAPETTDAQGDIYDAEVIEAAAHNFVAGYNKTTKLGFQHKEFRGGRFDLVESYIVRQDTTIGDVVIKAGTWIMTVRVLDVAVWKLVKAGKIKGFSIGGKAKVKKLKPETPAIAGQTGGQKL